MRRSGTLVLVLSVLAFAGSAYAGNGNGNRNGKGNGNGGAAADTSPGNSASAPGQLKQDAAASAPVSTTTVAATTTTTAAAADTNASGVKPSNTTAHETHAAAQSDKTKEYGNGETAGQIAEKNGAASSTVLHGPGNSQPHKAAPCSRGHEVDVHALKSHRSRTCVGNDPAPRPDPKPHDPPSTTTTPKPPVQVPKGGHGKPGSEHGGFGIAGHVVATSRGGAARGVLSATSAIGHAATLPFTGQSLWAAVLAGLVLVAAGFGLRQIRTSEAPVQSGHDHTHRSRHNPARSRRPFGGRSGR